MASHPEGVRKDEVKEEFLCREGQYKLLQLSEYARPNRANYNGPCANPVFVSFVNTGSNDPGSFDKICFNVGKELFFYPYHGIRKAADLTKPIDKRTYKGTYPTCHSFNSFTSTDEQAKLLVGFSAGQVQLIDPITRQLSKLYNEERLIDKTRVSCLQWLPDSPGHFLVSHASGNMYVYDETLQGCGSSSSHSHSSTLHTPIQYQTFKHGEGFIVYTCKTKTSCNPTFRWKIGEGALYQFRFSHCKRFLATVSQDGFLRVFDYSTMSLLRQMKSYFGGLHCLCWSPDDRYIATGGEDDLVTVFSVSDGRVICRARGHHSWVSAVAFDPYTSTASQMDNLDRGSHTFGSDSDMHINSHRSHKSSGTSLSAGLSESYGSKRESVRSYNSSQVSIQSSSAIAVDCNSMGDSKTPMLTNYRVGSVGQDTLLCLWDITGDILKRSLSMRKVTGPVPLTRGSSGNDMQPPVTNSNSVPGLIGSGGMNSLPPQKSFDNSKEDVRRTKSHHHNHGLGKFATLSLDKPEKEKHHRRNFSLGSRSSTAERNAHRIQQAATMSPSLDGVRLLGTKLCPRLHDVPLLEPLVCKKVSQEILTTLHFLRDCFVVASQDGTVSTWARPGKANFSSHSGISEPTEGKDSSFGDDPAMDDLHDHMPNHVT